MNPELRLDEKTLAHVPKGDRIFVCSNLDLFADAIPSGWIQRVLSRLYIASEYWGDWDYDRFKLQYMFLTKNPDRYKGFWFEKYMWLGTTWDGLEFTQNNIKDLFFTAKDNKYFVSFEPLLADPRGKNISISAYDWIIIGADSRRGQPKPPKEWADYLIGQARELNIPVFVKSNYGYPEKIQEYPE